MKKLFYALLCFGVLCFVGCSPPSPKSYASEKTIEKSISKSEGWEIWTHIIANLNTQDDGKVIITYHLGPVLIVDNIEVSEAWVHFIRSDAPLYIKVHVLKDNSRSCTKGLFRYYVEENFINPTTCCSPIDFSALERNADNIPGWIWNDDNSPSNELKELL